MHRIQWTALLMRLVGVQLLAVAGPGVAHAATGGGAAGPGPAEAHVAMALTIPAGTEIPVTIDENVTLKADQVGNIFPAHITRDVVVDDAVAIPGGAPANVILVASDEKPGAATFRLARVSIGGRMRRVETDVARADGARSGLNTAKKTGIGALAGGVLGVVTGGGLLKGAIVGAGGGLAWGLLSHGSQRVEADTQVLFPLSASVWVA
jgi:hypothetical protein